MRRTRSVTGVLGLVAALGLAAACSTPERIATPSVSTAPGASGGTRAPSATAPRQDATLEGRVVGLDGKPLAGVPISVVKTNTGFQPGRVLEAVVTFGLSCVASPDDCPFRNDKVVDSAVTDANGHYELTLPQAYLPGYETDADWVASVGRAPREGEATGPSSSYELEVANAIQAAPDLPLWDTAPQIFGAGGQVAVRVAGGAGMKAQVGAGTAGTVAFTTATGQNVWQVTGPVDARVLEDGPLRVVITGHVDLTIHHSTGRTIYHERLQTASVPYQGTAIPLSRNKACTLDQTPAVGCPLTDGDLVTGRSHEAGPVATLDLGAASPVGMVVVRATDPVGELTLEASTDGARWTALRTGPLGGASGVVATPGGSTTARYLRLTSTGGGELREVSVWPPLAHPLGGLSSSPNTNPSAGPVVLVMAGVLLALVAGSVVLVLSRRRRSRPTPP